MKNSALTYRHLHRVRYRECDPMGVLYHTHYLDIFEAARTEGLRSFGLAYKTLEDNGIMIAVVNVNVTYRRPSFYDELIAVDTTFAPNPGLRLPIHYEVLDLETEKIRVTGTVTLCCIDAASRKAIMPPEMLLKIFNDSHTDSPS